MALFTQFIPEKTLIAYFSHSGENYSVGNIIKGNTACLAQIIAEKTGATMMEIKPIIEYPKVYRECTAVAKQEQLAGIRPPIAPLELNFNQYQVIFLGYPIWWNEPPMPVYTFAENHDFSNKLVLPFCTHAGSGLAESQRELADLCFGAKMLPGLAVSGITAQRNPDECQKLVDEWLTATIKLLN